MSNGAVYRKPFAWSYSKLKNFESCAKRHYEIDLQKNFREEEGESLMWGNALHKASAAYLSSNGREVPPPGMEKLKEWCDKVLTKMTPDQQLLVEQQLAITKDFAPCAWFAKEAWYRGIADVAVIKGQVALVADLKTGKILEDSAQLALMAACVFAHHPQVQRIRTEFIWLAHDATTREDFSREQMPEFWRSIWPRIEALEHAYNTTTYPAKPSGLCRRWCVVNSCPHHGVGSN